MCVDATRNLFADHGGEMLAVNVVMRRGWIELGDLIDDDIFSELRRRLRHALEDVNVPAVGGFDVSLNEHEAEEFAPYWAPHAFILVPSRPMRRREARIPGMVFGRRSDAAPDFHPRV